MVGIIETCIEASCSAFADMVLGGCAGTGIIGTVTEPFFGEACCGTLTFAEACGEVCGVLMGK